ncbi:hypothetical protein G7Z17_g1815 [Cylindrodendrum hubeiense]|uniref:NACHT domain-containing protein n=1 Tax=Cylindrodendrum hubeiense TaxID=595255 RepID=A0A9P5HK56_9HYPO|nr:hypothetical protein G7Z17_g1815 [Cylindrodendrum hubeiense]
MDPATAIGIVSGILSFVGAAEKILKLSWTLYNSVEGSSEETEMRLKLADSMAVISKRMIPFNQSALTEEDRSLVTLAQECNKLTNDIKKELQTLRPKRRKSKTQSGLTALKTLIVDPKIKELEKQLQHCRDQLHFHIAALSRGDSENIKALLASSKEDGTKLTRLELSITQLKQTLQDMTTMNVNSISDQALDQLKVLLHVGQDALIEVAKDRILRGIKAGFEDMSYRYQSVDSPFGETFEWILDLDGTSAEATKFIQWLSSGDGVFHICGKLGAGKSTLMKKLCEHERTKTELEKWSKANGGRKLIIANFFFYALGSDPRQKSLIGLYRTLLHQILTTSPGLIQNLLPDQWTRALSQQKTQSSYEILDDDIKRAFERLSKQQESNSLGEHCFSFFIDGLDEYQTTTSIDRREMVRPLINLANSAPDSFKICVSSRMENPFMDMFSEDTRLYLHELTQSDMEEYVQGNLEHVGTQEERRQLALSITKKAEGVFLWVVLVVQKIRKQSDDGARYSRLLGEIESLPTELNDLFQRILDTVGTTDSRLISHSVSLLHFLGMIPEAKYMCLWLNLSDFYFLEDYEADLRFAESAQFPNLGFDTRKEIEIAARRRLRGVCRGLLEGDKSTDIDFTHRSVSDFFKQERVKTKMHDESFRNMEALSQLKLASIKQYWCDVERQNDDKDDEGKKKEEEMTNRHSILVACLLEQRRKQNLDTIPFSFVTCLDTIPQLSVGKTISRATEDTTVFRISLSWKSDKGYPPYTYYEICHTSRVRHTMYEPFPESRYWSQPTGEPSNTENSMVLWRPADKDVDNIEEYSRPVISPLFTELCSGRLQYPAWRTLRIHDMPLESETLAMLVYCAIGTSIGRIIWKQPSNPSAGNNSDGLDDDEDLDDEENEENAEYHEYNYNLTVVGHCFLQHLFENQIVSPNLLTHLAFGGQFASIRIAAGDHQLSIWQHFLCWWAIVAAASGYFDSEEDNGCDYEFSVDYEGQLNTGFVLETFVKNGADLHLLLKIEDGEAVSPQGDDAFMAYTLKMIPVSGEALELDVVVNIHTRRHIRGYPYGSPRERYYGLSDDCRTPPPLPKVPLSIRDWLDRSQLPTKARLLKLIDERLAVEEENNKVGT